MKTKLVTTKLKNDKCKLQMETQNVMAVIIINQFVWYINGTREIEYCFVPIDKIIQLFVKMKRLSGGSRGRFPRDTKDKHESWWIIYQNIKTFLRLNLNNFHFVDYDL